MKRQGFLHKTLLTVFSLLCFTFACLGICVDAVAQAAEGNIPSTIKQIEVINSDKTVIFSLSETDYITSPLPESITDVAQYKWVDALAYEDRQNYNVCNAVLELNLNEFNYADYILVDGVAVKNYSHILMANKFQRVNGLGITFTDDVLTNATEIELKAGCTIPTLARSYFGVEEQSAIVIEEDTLFRKHNGVWALAYRFSGYEAGVVYDASEQYFYGRPVDSNFKGHLEAPTCQFSRNYEAVGDYDYVLASTKDTVKGSLFVMEFINPIDAEIFTTIHLRFYVHEPRTMVTYNASEVTEESLGEPLEDVLAAGGWASVSLTSALYVNDDGLVDTLVFQFTNDGDLENEERNYVGVGEFSLGAEKSEGMIHDKSLIIKETEEAYLLNFRFNKKGEFTSDVLDGSKFLINGVSFDDIKAAADGAEGKWISLRGIYQINITLPKTYTGEGQLKNADLDYACNKITLKKGFAFPNGEQLDKTYNYNVYRAFTDSQIFEKEIIIDVETDKAFEETKVTNIFWEVREDLAGNLCIHVRFNKNITNTMVAHICEHEKWRESTLNSAGLYDKTFSGSFIAGGYKTSLMDSIVINGQTIGDIHARNTHQTCIFAHYGQTSFYGIDISINSGTMIYEQLAPLFEQGNGVTIEIKEGFKFATGKKTAENFKFDLKDGVFVLDEDKTATVYFDGQPVENGETLNVDYEALESSVYVTGVNEYQVTKTADGDTATFTVTHEGGTFVFHVKQTVVKSPDVENPSQDDEKSGGCFSSAAIGAAAILTVLAGVMTIGRKRDE